MPRAANFGYQDPTQAIGSSLVRAIFGDPTLAAKARTEASQQALREAQTEKERRQGGLYLSQTGGQDRQNAASDRAPQFYATLAPQAPAQGDPTQPSISAVDPGYGHFAAPTDAPMAPQAPAPPPMSREDQFRAALPAFMANAAQMRGGKTDPNADIATLASFLGNDELARRGAIAKFGKTDPNFATTSDRADEIASNSALAKQMQAFGVARINGEHYIPVANIHAASAANVAGIQQRGATDRSHITAASHDYQTDAHYGGTAPPFTAITKAIPGATMNSGWRSAEHNREEGGISNSSHLGLTPGRQGYDIPVQPGMTINEAAAKIEEANGGAVKVVEVKQHRAQRPDGTMGGLHWHFALQATGAGEKPGKAAAAAPVKFVSTANAKQITDAVDTYFKNAAVTLSDSDKATIYAQAITHFQQSGNPVLAVQQTIQDRVAKNRAFRDQQAAARSQPSGTLQEQRDRLASETARANSAGARQAPDGNWYVRTGTRPNGTPAYSRFDSGVQDAPASPRASAFSPAPRTVRGVVQVSNPAEAMALAPGTPYITHDGRAMVR